MKQLKYGIPGVIVNSDLKAFRRYRIDILNKWGDYVNVYQNKKPTIKELKEYKERHYNRAD